MHPCIHPSTHPFPAPGDFVTTPKLAEAMAMGGAGGPIPVLVLPSKATDASGLPYSSWLDYCEAACSSSSGASGGGGR